MNSHIKEFGLILSIMENIQKDSGKSVAQLNFCFRKISPTTKLGVQSRGQDFHVISLQFLKDCRP